MLVVLVDLPIDHFRLLGVSPSANPDAILRKLQARADAPPDQGFTHDVLRQRDELLRRSADLLVDPVSRGDYESTLLELSESHPGDTVGLDLSPSHEVAGLILLWEAHAALETFHLVRQALQPPQAPALGSSREADLTLLAALACRDAAIDEQRQRRYEIAAHVLKEGIELQIRMGKLPDQQSQLQQELEALTPYRILDLVSRDLAEQDAHQQGLVLLDKLVVDRGGLEGGDEASPAASGLSQADFEPFFKQIRRFLTVQEQIDLFGRWFDQGSMEAGCLSVFALTAAGFSRRKPERLEEARDRLVTLSAPDLDPMPMLGCLDLLLGNVAEASRHFSDLRSPELLDWFANHQGDQLAAQCEYCRAWLERDVLPGYRDVEATGIDLDAWFADRDVQAYVDRLDRQASRRSGSEDAEPHQVGFGLTDLWTPAEATSDPPLDLPDQDSGFSPRWAEAVQRWLERGRDGLSRRTVQASGGALVVAGLALVLIAPWRSGEPSQTDVEPPAPEREQIASPELPPPVKPPLKAELRTPVAFAPVTDDQPSLQQLQAMVQAWLDAKALALSGDPADLSEIARERLQKRVVDERAADAAAGHRQLIEAMVTSAEPVSAAANRIEIRAQIEYKDRTVDGDGDVVDQTAPTAFTIRYVFGRDGQQWKLHEYIADR